MHFGRVVELCYEKGSELSEDDPDRVAKGRAVFLGDNVKDQDFQFAVFEELGSAPPSIEAAKALDAFSLMPGYEETQSDAFSAYTQSFLRGKPTHVALPYERWPDWWKKQFTIKDSPVCPLVLALYGHPDSGGYWDLIATSVSVALAGHI